MNKTPDYWIDVQRFVNELAELANETQGPIIEEHLNTTDCDLMSVEEITAFCQQFYTEEQLQQWKELEEDILSVAEDHNVEPGEMVLDIWNAINNELQQTSSAIH